MYAVYDDMVFYLSLILRRIFFLINISLFIFNITSGLAVKLAIIFE